MAQQATPEVAAGASKRALDHQQPADTATVEVEQAAIDAPETVGAFEQLPVPNTSTTRWERVYQPTEAGEYPYAAVEYSINHREGDVRVNRSVQLYTATGGSQSASGGRPADVRYTKDLVASMTVAHGFETIADAHEFVVEVMEAVSADAGLPPELSRAQREAINSS